jgi:FKBP-type peptidyl-prolyl cis-trans isomerase FkpA
LSRKAAGAAWLPLLVLALVGCGGTVTEGTVSSDQPTAPVANSSAPVVACPSGADSTVKDNGKPDDFTASPSAPLTKTADGLQYSDFVVGNGATVAEGTCVTVQYTGWLADGTKFDSSRDRSGGFQLNAGSRGQVIKGWQEGIPGMKLGGKRRLIIPPDLGYGPNGQPPKIPPNSTLTFDVEVVRVH